MRVMVLAAVIAWERGLSVQDTFMLLDACAYHDIARTHNGNDAAHGERAAQKLPLLTSWDGDELKIVQAAVAAHSRADSKLGKMMQRYQVVDRERCREVTFILKDADALDRVRSGDLDISYLRLPESLNKVEFAERLLDVICQNGT